MMTLLGRALLWLGLVTWDDPACDIFLAPSTLNGGGWGVFAARDFEEYEIIELGHWHPSFCRWSTLYPSLKIPSWMIIIVVTYEEIRHRV